MTVDDEYISNKAKELAGFAREHFDPEQLNFFAYYSKLEDFAPEEDPTIVEKAWELWLKRGKEACLSDLAEDIRPKHRFIPASLEERIKILITSSGQIELEHDEQFALLNCTQAELRGIPWSLPEYPGISLIMLPERWWCSSGERQSE